MSKKKRTEHEATVVYKQKPGRPDGMQPQMYWYIKVDGEKVGKVSSLNDAAKLLYEHGYKVWAWRRHFKNSGRPAWRATVIKEHDV